MTELGWGPHPDLRCSESSLTPCAGFIGEAQASSPLASQVFAYAVEWEQRLRQVGWNLPCCLQNGLWVDCSFEEPGTSTLHCWPLSPAVTAAAGQV